MTAHLAVRGLLLLVIFAPFLAVIAAAYAGRSR